MRSKKVREKWRMEREENLKGFKDKGGVRKSREGGVHPVSPHHITAALNHPWRCERFDVTEGWKPKDERTSERLESDYEEKF